MAGMLCNNLICLVRAAIVDHQQFPLQPWRNAQLPHFRQRHVQQRGPVPGAYGNGDFHCGVVLLNPVLRTSTDPFAQRPRTAASTFFQGISVRQRLEKGQGVVSQQGEHFNGV